MQVRFLATDPETVREHIWFDFTGRISDQSRFASDFIIEQLYCVNRGPRQTANTADCD
jgi:hypothetical protein